MQKSHSSFPNTDYKVSERSSDSTYINAESELKAGLDFSLGIAPFKWLNVTLNANTFYVNTRIC